MGSAGRRTSFRPGRSSITGRVRAAGITATAWSRVRDLDGRPSWPLGVSARAATLRLIRSLASACRMARLSARCPIETAAVEYPAAMAASAWRTSAAVRSRSLRAPMTARIGSGAVLVFVMGLCGGAARPGGEPVPGGLPDGVVGVAGLGGDPFVELGVQVAELVHDGGLGRAA